MVIVAALAVIMIGATALATEDAFADKKRHDDKKKGGYEKSQAVSQVNYCGNGELSGASLYWLVSAVVVNSKTSLLTELPFQVI